MDNSVGNELIIWYMNNKRDLPWRDTSDPYHIWISEIILQQTRIAQGLPYYMRFIEEFPTVNALASASQEKVLKVWQGLGYYSRARNMHYTAKQVVDRYNGLFPSSYKELLELKGVGRYTAAAIASIAFGETVAAVDGNVIRVISRLYAIEQPLETALSVKEINKLADGLLIRDKAATYNQAIMEFGALHCVPVNPECGKCPISIKCLAYRYNMVNKIPAKRKTIKVKNRYFNYLVIHLNNSFLFRRREAGDIWEGLYEFPLIESFFLPTPEELPGLISENELFKSVNFEIIGFSEPISHLLSHQKLHIRFIHLRLNNFEEINSGFILKTCEDIHEIAVPRVIDKYLRSSGFKKIAGCS